MEHIPYTYLLNCPDGRSYYGVRYAKDCHPSEFWVTYFTSSEIISDMRKEYGDDSFTYEIRKKFPNDIHKAILWEEKVLYRLDVVNNNKWVNQSYLRNGGWAKSKEHNKKISQALAGVPKTEEHKQNMSKAKQDPKYTDIARANLKRAAEANTGKKRPEHSEFMKIENLKRRDTNKYVFVHKDGMKIVGTRYDLKEYDPSVSISELGALIKGRYKIHKQWTIIS